MPQTKILLPQFGMGMTEAEIQGWQKKVGDRVEEGDVLVEVEAAKALVEIPSPVSGILARIIAETGETVEVRSVLAIIET